MPEPNLPSEKDLKDAEKRIKEMLSGSDSDRKALQEIIDNLDGFIKDLDSIEEEA